jgi:hypothetical protein
VAVLLTVSETISGSQFADALNGGGTGIDFGAVITGQYAPLVNQILNTGHLDAFIRHDAAVDPVTDLKTFIQQYGSGTGFAYGGANTAALDIAKLLNMGNADSMGGSVGNNSDGLGGGLQIDMDWDVSSASQFQGSRIGTGFKRIYGDNGGAATGDGRNLATAFLMKADAMSFNSGGTEVGPSAAQDGKIGKSGDAVLGDRAHPRFRMFLRSDETEGGIIQGEMVIGYSFTA